MLIKSYQKFLFSSVISLLSLSSIFSQEIEFESVDILSKIALGRNTLVFNSGDIQDLKINSIDELLRYVPGIETQSRGGFGVQSDITLRGSTFNQVLVLIDGVRINDPLTGHFNGYIPISLGEIFRVEITKGAAASIYGADAVGGVINFITKYSQFDIENTASVEIKKGSNKYRGIEMSILHEDSAGWFFGGSLMNNFSKGEVFSNPNFTNHQLGPEKYSTSFNLSTYGIAIGKQINEKWRVHLRASGDTRDFDAKYFYTSSKFDESFESVKIISSQLHATRIGKKTNTTIDLAQRFGQDVFVFNPLFSTNNHRSQYYLLQGNQYYVASEKLSFNYGIQSDWRAVFSNDRGNHQNVHFGSHTLATYKIHKQLESNIGLRVDWDDNYKFEFNPHFNLVYTKSKFSIRGSINRAIRAPDYTERFISTEKEFLLAGKNLGNPNLRAESSWNAEVGAKILLGTNQSISTTYFSRFSSDLIDYMITAGHDISSSVQLDSTGNYNYALNVGNIVTNGLELDWNIQHKMNEKTTISGKIGYLWLETKKDSKFWSLENPDGLPPTKYLNSHATHLVNGFFIVKYQKFSISSNGIWKSRKTSFSDALGFPSKKDYFISNLSVNYNIIKILNLGLQINNVGNVQVQDVYGAVLPGRWFIGVLKIKI